MKFNLFHRGPQMVRCYDCGLDYTSKTNAACPRCGETRVIRRSAPFNDNSGTGWKLFGGSATTAAGHAAAELRKEGNDAMWRADNPEHD